jgi:ribosomal protein S18 acetylase RimI-like enzyme
MESELLVGLLEPESDLFLQAIDLRFRELRKPLGLSFTNEQLQAEKDQLTIAASDGDQVLGVLMMKPLDQQVVKVRQVAVDGEYQGRGIGKKMSRFAEELARSMGFEKIELNARKTAVEFYESMQYIIDSEEFTEVGIPHHRMIKSLS